MKRILLLLLLLSITTLMALPAFAKEAMGYYITLNYDTVKVAFSISQFNKHTAPTIDLSTGGRALYYDEHQKLQYLSPEDVLEIGATYKGYSMRKLARLHPNKSIFNSMSQYNNGYIFFDVHVDGLVKLLSYTEQHPGGFHKQVMLQYDNEALTQIEWDSFKTAMADFFKDYAALVDRINRGIYTKKDIMLIVYEYNEYHVNQSQLRAQEPIEGF